MTNQTSTTRRELARTTASIATVGAATWIALALDSLVRPGSRDYRDALFLLPWALFAATMIGLHLLARPRSGRLERWGYRALMSSMAVSGVGTVGVVSGSDALVAAAFPLGPLGFLVGLAAFGVGTARAGILPVRVGRLLAMSQLLTMAAGVALSPLAGLHETGSYSGAVVHGIVLLRVAVALRAAPAGEDFVADARASTGWA